MGRLATTSSLLGLLLLFTVLTARMIRAADGKDAQSSGGNLSALNLEQLGNIEVTTASKEPEEVWQTPSAIYVLTNEDIRRSGATSIPEALRLVPGVEVARIDSSGWAVGIRGFGSGFSKSVLVLIDGRNVYTPLFAGVNWRLQNVMLEDVDRIEVTRGPGGTIWGTNAVNGVINIITKNSKDSRGAVASVGGGTVDQGTGTFRYGGGLRQNLSYRVYGMAFGRGAEFHSDHGNFDEWQLGQGGFRMDWDDQRSDTITIQGDLYKGSVGERENIGIFSPPSSIIVDTPEDVSGANILGRWQHKMRRGSDLQVQAYYDRTYRLSSQLGETRNTFDFDFIHHLTLLPRQDIIWGAGARWSPSDLTQVQASVDFEPHHQSDNIYSTFVQDEIAIVKNKLRLTLGSKFEHNIYTGWETQPSARLLWTPGSHQTVWAGVSRAIRSPSRIDENLQLTGFAGFIPLAPAPAPPIPLFLEISGNPNFVSEKLLAYEAGYRRLVTSRLYVDVSAFHNVYTDLTGYDSIVLTSAATPAPPHLLYVVTFGNALRGATDGIEIAPDWKVTDSLRLKGSYSYLHMGIKPNVPTGDTGTAMMDNGSSPHHEVVAQALFNLPARFEFDPTYRYVSELPLQSVKSYSTMDLRLSRRLGKQIELSVVGNNLFQPHHTEFGGDPGPLVGIERTAYAKITWKHESR